MDEVDRYSQGLVREELRKLQLLKPRNSVNEFILNVIRREDSHIYRNGSISEPTVKATRYKSLRTLKDLYGSFKERRFKAKVTDGPRRLVDSFFYWSPREMIHKDESYRNHLVLHRGNLSLSTKELIYDNHNCMVYTTFHMLYRMLERGMIASRPLQHLNDSADDWMGWCAFYMFAHQKGLIDGPTGLIPFCGGAILCTVGTTAYDMTFNYPIERLRIISGHRGHGSMEIPFANLLEKRIGNGRGSYSIDLNTWISSDQFSLEQEWAIDRLIRLRKKHPTFLTRLADLFFDPLVLDRESFNHEIEDKPFLDTLFEMQDDPKWARACSW